VRRFPLLVRGPEDRIVRETKTEPLGPCVICSSISASSGSLSASAQGL
jgi:hypothetical protein